MFHLQAACANCIMQQATNNISRLKRTLNISLSYNSNSFSIRHYSRKHHATLTKSQLKRYCDILGVPVNASEAKIRQSFFKKSFLLHPDRNKHPTASQMFNEVSEAYQALLNYKKQSDHHHHHHQTAGGWHKDKSAQFRPWYQTHRKSPPPPPSFHQKFKPETPDELAFDNSQTGDSSGIFRHHSQASNWCDETHQKLFAKAVALKKMNAKRGKKDDGNESCVLM